MVTHLMPHCSRRGAKGSYFQEGQARSDTYDMRSWDVSVAELSALVHFLYTGRVT